MNAKSFNSELTLAEVFFQVYQQGRIDRNHRQHLRATLLKEQVSQEEQTAINRLLYAVRRGWLQVAE
jgi:protein-arginine kinase